MPLIIDQSLAWASLRSPLWSSRIVPSERGPVTGRTRAAGGGFRPARGPLTRRACARGRGRARSPRGKKEAAHEGAGGSVVGVREASHENGGTSPTVPPLPPNRHGVTVRPRVAEPLGHARGACAQTPGPPLKG